MTVNDESHPNGLVDIDEIVSRIRRLVNEPRKQNELIRHGAAWHQLCSALDVIGDAEWALDSHARRGQAATPAGQLYLAHYGFLQAAYLQQDAASVVQRHLGSPTTSRVRDPALVLVRNLRNQAVGHPTGGRYGAVHFIVRVTMCPDSFELMSIADDGSVEQQTVDCRELRQVQNRGIAGLLRDVVRELEEEKRMHLAQFHGQLLTPDLDKLSYPVGKVFETAHAMQRGSIAPGQDLGSMGLDHVEAAMTQLRAKLNERGYEPGVLPGADMAFDAISHAVMRLRGLFVSDAGEPPGRDAEAYATYLDVHLKQLKEFGREIDEEYTSTVKRVARTAATKVPTRKGKQQPRRTS